MYYFLDSIRVWPIWWWRSCNDGSDALGHFDVQFFPCQIDVKFSQPDMQFLLAPKRMVRTDLEQH